MNLLATLLLCLLGTVCVASVPAKEHVLSTTSRLTAEELQQFVAGCNANICFAIDGSGSISSAEFAAQKQFVQDIVAVLFPSPVEYAGVQYATTTSVISRLTPDKDSFSTAVAGTTQLGGGTSLARGINFCMRQLRRRRGEANKIVVLGDGRSMMEARAVRRANRFRSMGGEVCAVGAGFTDSEQLLAIAGGDAAKVFEVDNFLDVLDLKIIIEGLVLDICGASELV